MALSIKKIKELNDKHDTLLKQRGGRRYVSRAEKSAFDGNKALTTRYRINPDGSISRG